LTPPVPAARLALAYAAFVVYGSLLPFEFTPLPWDRAWAAFVQAPFLYLGVESRADWIANGVLYLPLGVLATLALAAVVPLPAAMLLALAGCTALAVGVEFAQVAFPPRTVSLNDLVAEFIGSGLGVAAAPWAGRRLARLVAAWSQGLGPAALAALPAAYAAAYLALALFPFDLLLDGGELRAKLASPLWGWVLAGDDARLHVVALKLAAEVVLAAPLGLLLRRWQRLGAVVAVGIALGIALEVAQLLIASGVSQGASVVARATGLVAGWWLLRQHGAIGWRGLSARLTRAAPWLWPAVLLALLAAHGLLTLGWHGLDGAAATWGALRLMPLYYHYYTTEAAALTSLGSVGFGYAVPALLLALQGSRLAGCVGVTALLALAIEAAKAFATGLRPDPTNLAIAAGAAWLVWRLVAWAQRAPRVAVAPVAARGTGGGSAATPSTTAGAGMAAPGDDPQPPSAVVDEQPLWAGVDEQPPSAGDAGPWPIGTHGHSTWQTTSITALAVAAALAGAVMFPVLPLLLATAIVGAALVGARWPLAPLWLLPAALPAFDLAPWSGRLLVTEFDLLSLACIGAAWWRSWPAAPEPSLPTAVRLGFVLVALALLLSALRGSWPAGGPGIPADVYHQPWNAWRIVKGALWAWALVLLWRRLAGHGAARGRALQAGMVAGLAITVAAIVVERSAFVGLADFASEYRVTALFSGMNKGGALVECWLALAAPFALVGLLRARSGVARVLHLLLLAATGYATMVTFSRNGYAALAVALLVTLLLASRGLAPGLRWRAALGTAAVVLAALPVLLGPYAQQRLASTAADWSVRVAHWRDGLQLQRGWTETLLGIGLGGYPQAHFWRSAEPVRAAPFAIVDAGGGRRVLRLGSGATVYVEQIVMPPPGPLNLTFEARRAPNVQQAGDAPLAVALSLCRKWTLTSRDCQGASAPVVSSAWQRVELALDAAALAPGWPPLPLKLALATPSAGAVDVRALSLRSADGREWLHNGDFADGMDRWFFATDVDPPWQVHSLPLTVWLEMGALGALAWGWLALAVGVAAWRLAWQGRAEVPAALPALAAVATSGLLNTLIDAPRFLGLLLLLAWLAARATPTAAASAPAGPQPGAPGAQGTTGAAP
jgi:VanZ family protein